MKYDVNWVLKSTESGKRQKFLFFWGHQPAKNGQLTASCFSQWWASAFRINEIVYPTAEHWMMAQKALLFNDLDAFKNILAARSPAEAKKIGREVANFDEPIWTRERYSIVLQGTLAKFGQNPSLSTFLLSTGNRILVEASPVDIIWGVGLAQGDDRILNPDNWQGLNLLGFALMEARDILANEGPSHT